MHVIGHEHVGVQGTTRFLQGRIEPVQIAVVVLVGKEARFAVAAALNDVQRYAIEVDAGSAWHGYFVHVTVNSLHEKSESSNSSLAPLTHAATALAARAQPAPTILVLLQLPFPRERGGRGRNETKENRVAI
jgi:hypothetical protein